MVADHIVSPLTHVLNTCILKLIFPVSWKIARISAIPKTSEVKTNNGLRPISLLPVFSKVYERLVLRLKADFLAHSSRGVLNDNLSACWKGHNTTTVQLAMRDDILRAMQ